MRHYRRFSARERTLHAVLAATFLGLVATGMPLRYSGSAWAKWLAHTLGGAGVMGFFHRTFAVLLTICFLLHVGQIAHRVLVRREAGILWGPDSIVPQPRDVVDLVQHLRWFLHLGPRPRFERFTYWEKFDYFAVFWGMVIIGASGYVLWFHGFASRFLPGWIFNVALLVHGEEALLAAGFIFAIHFFNTHLRPEKFPMDLVIFTGRVSDAEMREERPEEYRRRAEEGTLASIETDAAPAWLVRLGHVAGTVAVGIGFVLFLLILIAVLG